MAYVKRSTVFFLGSILIATSVVHSGMISIIPQPKEVAVKDGQFVISAKNKISYNDAKLEDAAEMLAGYIGVKERNVCGEFDKKTDFVLEINQGRIR